jgi:hypothetical protein
MASSERVDELEQVAMQLEAECPWESVSKVLSHNGWLDLVETIKAVSPEAYQALRRDLLK